MSFAPSTLVTTQTGEQTISRLAVGVTVLAASSASTACAGGLGGLSFSADTLVQTPSGEQPIASLQVGDHVTSYDPQTGKATTQSITHVYLNHDSDRLDVTLVLPATSGATPTVTATQDATSVRTQRALTQSHGRRGPPDASTTASSSSTATSGETIHTTANHPWLTADRGWVDAGQLHSGEAVQLLDGATATVVGLHALAGAGPMWDLSLDATHTFAVGTDQAVVHNDGGLTGQRFEPGTVSGGFGFPSLADYPADYFVQEGGARIVIPREVAIAMNGQSFDTFAEFRQAFWGEMGKQTKITGLFSQSNQALMAKSPAEAPFAPSDQGYAGRGRYEINHIQPLAEGGPAYDFNNLEVLSPRAHVAYHQNYGGGGC